MRVLILGGDGMLGHQLLQSWTGRHEVRVTVRKPLADLARHALFSAANTVDRLDVRDTPRLQQVLGEFRPQAVVNAVGVVKQRDAAHQALPCLEINSVFPHRLRELCADCGARMIHVSTDCVFRGDRGQYGEQDVPDATDLYGQTKHLGEVREAPAITLRTSIIGLELANCASLVEWFLAARGEISGFTRAIYTGVTTLEMARAIDHLLTHEPELTGLWQLASAQINKHDLLVQLASLLGRDDITIRPDDSFACDRSLDGSASAARTNYCVPSWDNMLQELARQIRLRSSSHAAA